VGISIVPLGVSAGSKILKKKLVSLRSSVDTRPVVVCLPGVGVELPRVGPGPVVEGDGGPRFNLRPGKQPLARPADSRIRISLSVQRSKMQPRSVDINQFRLVRIWSKRVYNRKSLIDFPGCTLKSSTA